MSIHKSPKHAPISPGVYMFKRGGNHLYIGKAENLKKRLSSYFRKNAGKKIESLRKEATKLEWIELSSDIEALIKESELIKKFRPKYNVLMRDDKSYFYAVLTKEEFPRIFITHDPKSRISGRQARYSNFKIKNSNFIGPFTSGRSLRTTLRLLRRVFPYCTCKDPHRRRCLSNELGLCPGYCCQIFDPSNQRPLITWIVEYRSQIKKIRAVLLGRQKSVLLSLMREMKTAAKNEEFERATRLRDEIAGLENIFSHRNFLELPRAKAADWGKISRVISQILGIPSPVRRVEGYDISNISGQSATGSMVVFVNGQPSKNEYRKFKIKTVHQANDIAMLREVIRRRMTHGEWHYPDLMLIDGGMPQLNAVRQELKTANRASRIKTMALAKREEELHTERSIQPIPLRNLPSDAAFFFQNVRNESHRFAKKYHHKLREMELANGFPRAS